MQTADDSPARIPVIGIVGGIGSGKSTLARALAQHFRVEELDADAAGHRALAIPEVQKALRNSFGNEIFDARGEIIRSALASRVFGPEETQQSARRQLEQIVHPRIHQQISEELERHQSRQACDLILLDAALLLEAGWSDDCDAVIFVDTPEELRRERVAGRGWSATELARREASQMALQEKRSRADLIVDNSQDIQTVANNVAQWIRQRFSGTSSRETSNSQLRNSNTNVIANSS